MGKELIWCISSTLDQHNKANLLLNGGCGFGLSPPGLIASYPRWPPILASEPPIMGSGASNPSLRASNPGLRASDPHLGAPNPGHGAPNPGLGAPNPSLRDFNPGLEAPNLGLGATNLGPSNPGLGAAHLGQGGHTDIWIDVRTDVWRRRKLPTCECIGHRPLWGRCTKGKNFFRDD